MANEYKSDFDFNKGSANKRIIPDNEYLPFVPIKQTLMEMEPGDIIAWPETKTNSVRILSHRIAKETERVYRCVKNRKEKTVDVCRLS